MCQKDSIEEMINFGKHPITKFLLEKQDDKYDTYPIVLVHCTNCGHIQLRDAIPSDKLYGKSVNLSSWKNQPHIPRIVQLIKKLSIGKKNRILEIGSNDCSFLRTLQDEGYKRLTGVDPGSIPCDDIATYNKYFTTELAKRDLNNYQLVICRHVLEHIDDILDFGEALKLVSPNAYILIEVPDFDFFLSHNDYSGVWEEHVQYFTLYSLTKYLLHFGIEIISSEYCNYSGRSLLVIAKNTGRAKLGIDIPNKSKIVGYRSNWPIYKKRLHMALSGFESLISIYGAGCRAQSLINYTDISRYIHQLVDDQKEKQFKFAPGSRLKIRPPVVLQNEASTCLLAVNTENEDAAVKKLRRIGFTGTIRSILALSEKYALHP